MGQNEEKEGKREVAAHEVGIDGRAGARANCGIIDAIYSRQQNTVPLQPSATGRGRWCKWGGGQRGTLGGDEQRAGLYRESVVKKRMSTGTKGVCFL